MALSQFPITMPAAVSAVLRVSAALRYLRDTSGDLTFHSLNEVQDGLREAKSTTFAALAEGGKSPEAAELFMAGLGGPATLAEYYTAAADIESKAAGWNGKVNAILLTLPVECVIGMVPVTQNGITTKHIEYKSFIPAQYSDELRSSPELAALIAAFEGVGA